MVSRSVVVGVAITAVVLVSLSGCTPRYPMAFRLGSDGSLDVAFCDSVHFDTVEVTVEPRHWFWEQPADATLTATVPGGTVLEGGESMDVSEFPSNWLVTGELPPVDQWETIDVLVTRELTEDDYGTYVGDGIARSQLIVDEWVWSASEVGGAVRHCAPIDGIAAPRG